MADQKFPRLFPNTCNSDAFFQKNLCDEAQEFVVRTPQYRQQHHKTLEQSIKP
jgi:hypothetical protein